MRDKIENIVADYKRKVQHLENDMVNELCDLHIVRERYIDFALWLTKYQYRKKEHTHPKNVGKWWSDYDDKGYLTDEELIREFLNAL